MEYVVLFDSDTATGPFWMMCASLFWTFGEVVSC